MVSFTKTRPELSLSLPGELFHPVTRANQTKPFFFGWAFGDQELQ
jgi:hypothetical protein